MDSAQIFNEFFYKGNSEAAVTQWLHCYLVDSFFNKQIKFWIWVADWTIFTGRNGNYYDESDGSQQNNKNERLGSCLRMRLQGGRRKNGYQDDQRWEIAF